jgi:hypothetical protein
MTNPLEIPIIPVRQTFAPNTVAPKDLSGEVDKMMDGYRQGFLSTQDIQKQGIVGASDAVAARDKNFATSADAKQDRLDAEGAPVKPGVADYSTMSTDQLTQIAKQLGLL